MRGDDVLTDAAGSWQGRNAFRLMPTDEPFSAEATAEVATTDAGSTLTYTWLHPMDGPQSGRLDLDVEGGARWQDTWHQGDPQSLDPIVDAGADTDPDTVGYEYLYEGDWRWQLWLTREDDALRLRMVNVVPASALPEGQIMDPYNAMDLILRATR